MEAIWTTLTHWLQGLGSGMGGDPASPAGEAALRAVGQFDFAQLMALAAMLGWASGFRLYAAVFLVGAAATAGWIVLPPGLQVLEHPAMLLASGLLLFIEFFADKIPGVDSVWDLLQAAIRIPAGAALAAGALGADGATMAAVGALMGGTLAATSQAAKFTTRAAINTSPEPATNLLASLTEDGLVVLAFWLAATHPVMFGVLLVAVVLLMWIVTWALFKFLRKVFHTLTAFLSGTTKAA
ncbi:MAG: DUF4126 domain-containing protein [Burkholderiaceae bacterium]|nr:DUF4126 domain-containing protein [Burkholderiaceae bacterium]